VDDVRRKLEKDALIAAAAEDLAKAAQAVLDSAAGEQSPDGAGLDALSAALTRYREATR
jgi:hypothetical protein